METIRDVIIRISLKMGRHQFAVPPEFQEWAKQTQAAADKVTESVKQAEQTVATEAGQAMAESKQRLAEREESGNRLISLIREEQAAEQSAVRTTRDRAGAQLESINRNKQALELQGQRLEALALAANGLFTVARGIAFVTAANEDDYQQTLKWLAGIQGSLDLFNGLITSYKSVIAFKKASTAATLAEIAANKGLAASQVEGSLAQVAKGALGGRAGLGRLLAGGAAVGGAVALGGLVLNNGINQFGQDQYGDQFSGRGLGADVSDDDRSDRINKGLADMERRFSQLEQRVTREGQLRQLAASAGVSLERRFELAREDRDLALQPLGRGMLPGGVDNVPLARAKEEQAAQQILVDFERERQALLQERAQGLQTELAAMRQAQDIAAKTLQLEEQRQQSLEARIGRLQPQELAQLKQIAESRNAGKELSLDQARFLEQTGVGGALAEARFRQEGQNAGAGGILQALGEQAPLQQARKNAEFANNAIAQAAEEVVAETEETARELVQSFKDMATGIRNLGRISEEVDRLREELGRMGKENGINRLVNRGPGLSPVRPL
jgi:hypothetical protein